MSDGSKTPKPKATRSRDEKSGETPPKRRNRSVPLSEAANAALDPIFRKRGFASRDIYAHWADIAPEPYNQSTMPDRLQWPRRESGAEGAVLHLRCRPGAGFAVEHDSQRIAQSVNRYFGYFLVASVKISREPFVQPEPEQAPPPLSPEVKTQVGAMTEAIGDDALRAALRELGYGILGGGKGRR